MSSPVVSIEKLRVESDEKPVCPITMMPFVCPWILLEDGFTYEKSAIERWLKSNPNKSPMIGKISSATLLPNCTVNKMDFICPITRESFQEPYYCVEDGHTYEKDAISKWFEVKIRESLEEEKEGEILPTTVRSPVSGVALNSLTLYPNKILFSKGIPQEQKPQVVRINIEKIVSESTGSESQEVKCIFDSEIRKLIESYISEKESEKKRGLKLQIEQRREHLGLSVDNETLFCKFNIDLSHLNLSGMNLKGLDQKGSIFKDTDLSDSILDNCKLSHCRFLRCNMQRTVFINCNFTGERVSFFKTDMKDAVIEERCYLEKGGTWKMITNWEDFVAELSNRGAMNVDSVTLRRQERQISTMYRI